MSTPTPNIDQELRTRLLHMHNALSQPEVYVTQHPAFVGACGACRVQVQQAVDGLDAAMSASATDAGQNNAATAAFKESVAIAIDEYGMVRDAAAQAVRPRRRKAVSAAQIAKNEAFFARAFATSPSDLIELRHIAIVSYLETTHQALAAAPFSLPSEDVQAFSEAILDLKAKRQEVTNEALDDAPLLETLRQARAAANTALVGTRSILSGILRLEKNPLSIDEFISRRAAPTETPPAAPSEQPTNG